MENATKALLIAAAVLVAILIISLGVGVFNLASESMGDVSLDEYEVQTHNDKFVQYAGDSVRGSKVNTLLKTVFNHNLTEADSGKKVTIDFATNGYSDVTGDETEMIKKVDTGKTFNVVLNYTAETGLINSISISENGAKK